MSLRSFIREIEGIVLDQSESIARAVVNSRNQPPPTWSSKSYSPDRIWVTELTGCVRRSYYRRLNPQPFTPSPSVLAGREIHRIVAEAVQKTRNVKVEEPVSTDGKLFSIVGKADLLFPVDRFVVELKTVNNIPDEPRPDHLMQVQFYAHMTKTTPMLLYIRTSEKSREVEVMTFVRKREYPKTVFERGVELYNALKTKTPPTTMAKGECKFCEWRHICGKSSVQHREKPSEELTTMVKRDSGGILALLKRLVLRK